MKNKAKVIGAAVLAASLFLTSVNVVAQASPSDNSSSMNMTDRENDGDDDGGKWGLAGLIGLVGLLGLKGKDNDTRRTSTGTTVNR